MPNLPVNIDASYADDPNDPSRQVHQGHHDVIHETVNRIPDDGAAVLTKTTGNAAYQKLAWFDVTSAAYGATGDGVTNDAAAIQAALNAANTAGGGVVHFPEGTYAIATNLTVYNNTYLYGPQATILALTGATSPLTISSRSNVTIDGLTVDGGTLAGVNQAIFAQSCTDLLIRDVTVQNLRTSSASSNLRVNGGTRTSIIHCRFTNGYRGVWVQNVTTTYASQVTVKDCTFDTFTEMGTYFFGDASGATEYVTIEGCHFTSITGGTARQPLYFTTGDTSSHRYIRVLNNTCVGNGTVFSAGGNGDLIAIYDVQDGLIQGNRASAGGDIGISVWRSERIRILDNHCSQNFTPGINLWTVIDAVVSGNVCHNNYAASPALSPPYGGIRVQDTTTNVYIGGNRCLNDTAIGTSQDYGIVVKDATCTGIVIGPNQLTGNATGEVSDSGTGTVRNMNRSDDARRFMTASEFVSGAGAPNISALQGRTPTWYLDAATDEALVGSFEPPTHWNTYNVVAVWANASTGAGAVRYRLDYVTSYGPGDDLTGITVGSAVDSTAAAQYVQVEATLASGIAVPGAGQSATFRVYRLASNAADTLPNDAAFLGLRLVRAS